MYGFTGSGGNVEIVLGFKILRVLRVTRLLFRVKVVRDVLQLAFSSMKSVFSLVFFLIFVIIMCAILGMHMFFHCHRTIQLTCDLDTDACRLPLLDYKGDLQFKHAEGRSGFSDFFSGFLAVTQIITGDNWTGLALGYRECNGYRATLFFAFINLFCNFFVLNLFVAVFLENFELSDEAKAIAQADRFIKEQGDSVAGAVLGEGEAEHDQTKSTQLRVLQLAMYLDENANKHVFRRLKTFNGYAANQVLNTPSRSKKWAKEIARIPGHVKKAKAKLRMFLNDRSGDGSIRAGILETRESELNYAQTILDEAVKRFEICEGAMVAAQDESKMDGWMSTPDVRKLQNSDSYIFRQKIESADAKTTASVEYNKQRTKPEPVWVQVSTGFLRIRHSSTVIKRVFRALDTTDVDAVMRDDLEDLSTNAGGVLSEDEMDTIMLEMDKDETGYVNFPMFEVWWSEVNALRYKGPSLKLLPILNQCLISKVVLDSVIRDEEDTSLKKHGKMSSEDMKKQRNEMIRKFNNPMMGGGEYGEFQADIGIEISDDYEDEPETEKHHHHFHLGHHHEKKHEPEPEPENGPTKAVWDDQEMFDKVHAGKDEDLVEDVELNTCTLSTIESTNGKFIMKLGASTGFRYILMAKTMEEAEAWLQALHANAEFGPKLMLLNKDKLEAAADVTAAEHYKAECERKRDKLVKQKAFIGSTIMRNTLGKAMNIAQDQTHRVLTKLNIDLTRNKNKDLEDELDVVKNKHNYFYKEQANREKLTDLLSVSRDTKETNEGKYRDSVREIATLHSDCKMMGWLHQAKHDDHAHGSKNKKRGKELRTVTRVWLELEDGQLIMREQHSDTALLDKFKELDPDGFNAIDKWAVKEILSSVKMSREGLELQTAMREMLQIDLDDAKAAADAAWAARLQSSMDFNDDPNDDERRKNNKKKKKKKKNKKKRRIEAAAKKAFQDADIDHDGYLDHEEVRILCEAFGVNDEDDMEDAIAEMDADLDGEISLREYMKWWRANVNGKTFAKSRDGIGEGGRRLFSTLKQGLWGEEANARNAFKDADADCSGLLDHDEMRALAMTFGITDEDQLDAAIEEMDEDLNGEISLKEFLAWWKKSVHKAEGFFSLLKKGLTGPEAEARNEARNAFLAADADGNGTLDHDEIMALAMTFGINDQVQLEQAIAEMDTDNDGEVSLQEFMIWFRERLVGEKSSGSEFETAPAQPHYILQRNVQLF